jgi:release factor glutamine methyltransferase
MHFLYEVREMEITAYIKRLLMSHITGLTTAQLLAEPNLQLTEEQRVWMEEAICRLENNEPLQHVLGYGEFYGRKFKCDGRALVPRPETEELVDWIINDWATINSRQLPINVLDIGTGTGCIALSLAKELEGAKITAVDISTAALSLARENAEILEAKDVRFIECDILGDCNVIEEGYDVIVSNPPYVRECEKKEMEANVLDYDPHTALFVSDEDPLVFYRAIAEFALTHLTPNGALYFEINQYLGRETCDLLVAMGYRNVELRDDINGNARMVRATL